MLPVALALLGLAALPFDTLKEGDAINGFKIESVYLNGSGQAMGGRAIHRRSGFTLDLLSIESAPQGFIWVTSYPTSNMGEPHTQEHLLLGKGDKGRAVANLESMSLASSSAFTMQWRTCYVFYTSAGPEVFYRQFEHRVDALLHPDYTDEEVRREVRNFGVSEDPAGNVLRLEEKGTVYNEMVTSMDQPAPRVYRALFRSIYGPEHPMSYSSGGLPEDLRALRPQDIRTFHDANYHLANMGMIGALPKEMALGPTLARFDAILNRLQPGGARKPVRAEADLPAPQPAPAGEIQIVEYPDKNPQQPGNVWFAWPANRHPDAARRLLLKLFIDNIAGDATTNLYKRFIDSRTRELDLGANGVFGSVSNNPGHPVFLGLRDVAAAHLNETEVADLRRRVREELARIAAWPDASQELAEFNARLRNRVVEARRDMAKFVSSPPGFGFRSARAQWMEYLDDLAESPGFRKSLTLQSELAAIENLLAGDRNFWRESLTQWKLLDVEPYGAVTRANPALIQQAQRERETRARDEIARLREQYKADSDQEALRQYRADYDAATAKMERTQAGMPVPQFVDKPPLSLDEHLNFKVSKLAGVVPLVESSFAGITSATAGIALRVDRVPESRLVYLAALPSLLIRAGVIENGKPVGYEQMAERLRKEVLSLNASFSVNHRTGRAELVVRGAGNDLAESRQALEWMRLALYHPDWRSENLPRIRDVVDQAYSSFRNTMQMPEEYWVQKVSLAWRNQGNPALLAADCFLTQAHNAWRLRWMLKEGDDTSRQAVAAMLGEAAAARGSRAELQADFRSRIAQLAPPAKSIADQAAKDLDQILTDVPDSSVAADWSTLCNEMRTDLILTPARALAELDALRHSLLAAGNARMFLIASPADEQKLLPEIGRLVAALEKGPVDKAVYQPARRIEDRLRARDPDAVRPVFVGLLNPNSQGGVFLNSAPGTSYLDTDREKLLDYLAANLYSGHGAHGMFMKTWAAGLAYSNGIRPSLPAGRLGYYAERTPELPQTLRFVIEELKKAQPDASLAEYAIAEAFGDIRSASSYESRGEAMANDIADGLTPAVVARFYKALLELRHMPNLSQELHNRMLRVYARVLPGLGGPVEKVPGGVYFVIGPEKQFAAYEEYLKTKLYRLYPRDFWMQ